MNVYYTPPEKERDVVDKILSVPTDKESNAHA
jgi:hypothetical protein